MNPRPWPLRALAAACALHVLAGAAAPARQPATGSPWGLPPAATEIAQSVDGLYTIILWLTLGVLALVSALLVLFMVRYRKGARERAHHARGSVRLELLWAGVPAVLLAMIAWRSNAVWSDIKEGVPPERDAYVVLLKPRQFEWDVVYPGADGRFATSDDVEAINRVDVPAGRNVVIRLQSQDVIHSFFVPEFRIKQDAVPGMLTRVWFNVPDAGTYEIACSELCGLGHYRMRALLVVHEQSEFEGWKRAQHWIQ